MHLLDFLLEFLVLESSFHHFFGHPFDLESQVLVNIGEGVNGDGLPRKLLPIVVIVGHKGDTVLEEFEIG